MWTVFPTPSASPTPRDGEPLLWEAGARTPLAFSGDFVWAHSQLATTGTRDSQSMKYGSVASNQGSRAGVGLVPQLCFPSLPGVYILVTN